MPHFIMPTMLDGKRELLQELSKEEKAIHMVKRNALAPPKTFDYVYYFSIAYPVMGCALGLRLSLVGGGLLAILARLSSS